MSQTEQYRNLLEEATTFAALYDDHIENQKINFVSEIDNSKEKEARLKQFQAAQERIQASEEAFLVLANILPQALTGDKDGVSTTVDYKNRLVDSFYLEKTIAESSKDKEIYNKAIKYLLLDTHYLKEVNSFAKKEIKSGDGSEVITSKVENSEDLRRFTIVYEDPITDENKFLSDVQNYLTTIHELGGTVVEYEPRINSNFYSDLIIKAIFPVETKYGIVNKVIEIQINTKPGMETKKQQTPLYELCKSTAEYVDSQIQTKTFAGDEPEDIARAQNKKIKAKHLDAWFLKLLEAGTINRQKEVLDPVSFMEAFDNMTLPFEYGGKTYDLSLEFKPDIKKQVMNILFSAYLGYYIDSVNMFEAAKPMLHDIQQIKEWKSPWEYYKREFLTNLSSDQNPKELINLSLSDTYDSTAGHPELPHTWENKITSFDRKDDPDTDSTGTGVSTTPPPSFPPAGEALHPPKPENSTTPSPRPRNT